MSARKAELANAILPGSQHVTVHARATRLALSLSSVVFHRSGIEFRSATAFPSWAEMTVTLKSPKDGAKLHCNGVVISCTGNRHTGYHVSMVFTGMSHQAEATLSALAQLT